jgi:photoactive yellow protein
MANVNQTLDVTGYFELAPTQVAAQLEQLSASALDALSFGVIRIDAAGRVVFFSHTEAKQSGYGDRDAIGKKLFTELAPCMGTPDFARRVELAQAAGTLDICFEQVGDFDDRERKLRVRMVAAAAGGAWIVLQRAPSESHR